MNALLATLGFLVIALPALLAPSRQNLVPESVHNVGQIQRAHEGGLPVRAHRATSLSAAPASSARPASSKRNQATGCVHVAALASFRLLWQRPRRQPAFRVQLASSSHLQEHGSVSHVLHVIPESILKAQEARQSRTASHVTRGSFQWLQLPSQEVRVKSAVLGPSPPLQECHPIQVALNAERARILTLRELTEAPHARNATAENLQELGLRVARYVLQGNTRENGLRHRYRFASPVYLGNTLLKQELPRKFLVSTAK